MYIKELFNVNNTEYSIRLFDQNNDSVEELTDLLHRAYKPLAEMGLNFIATHQTVEYTRKYFRKGECYILLEPSGKMCATIFYYNETFRDAPEIFKDKDTVLFGKFAVEPDLQKLGIGSRLMDFAESLAKSRGKKRMVLDTSENAEHLIKYYNKRGYKYLHSWQWPDVNYKSVVMVKDL